MMFTPKRGRMKILFLHTPSFLRKIGFLSFYSCEMGVDVQKNKLRPVFEGICGRKDRKMDAMPKYSTNACRNSEKCGRGSEFLMDTPNSSVLRTIRIHGRKYVQA